eukprot:10307398-Lingulodinium_polyedra.AAC.1
MSCVLRAQRHGPCSTLGSCTHPGPFSEAPAASRTCGGSPEIAMAVPSRATRAGKRTRAARAGSDTRAAAAR